MALYKQSIIIIIIIIVHAHDVSEQIPREKKFSVGLKMLQTSRS